MKPTNLLLCVCNLGHIECDCLSNHDGDKEIEKQ